MEINHHTFDHLQHRIVWYRDDYGNEWKKEPGKPPELIERYIKYSWWNRLLMLFKRINNLSTGYPQTYQHIIHN